MLALGSGLGLSFDTGVDVLALGAGLRLQKKFVGLLCLMGKPVACDICRSFSCRRRCIWALALALACGGGPGRRSVY